MFVRKFDYVNFTGREIMDQQPLVSVIALCYNHAPYVIECLDSIRKQTYKPLELIIVDDSSMDSSVSLIRRWISENKIDCKTIFHNTNLGVCKSLNEALLITRGEFFSIIATDDVWLENKIELQMKVFQASSENTGVIYSDAYRIDEKGEFLDSMFIQSHRKFSEEPRGDIFSILLKGNFIPAPSVLIKRSCFDKVGNYDEELCYEDYDMWIRMASLYEFAFCPQVCTKYRVLQNSLSRRMSTQSISNRWDSEFKIFKKCIEIPGLNKRDLHQLKSNISHCVFQLNNQGSLKIDTHLWFALRYAFTLKVFFVSMFVLFKIPLNYQKKILMLMKSVRQAALGLKIPREG